ncbi:hypothetical protein B0T25DRAFT_566805 [Lasiosphaeria hispida]|uniref:DUF6546 domain-containing protein n=1 Tax=Lasiosphaeria hispida TaxID=260671 RepID=A0AAJ0HMY0_9PEZI|nr:hypothetical protein B0T25DRAFT_566805 [Lasiosphaeria hispida]
MTTRGSRNHVFAAPRCLPRGVDFGPAAQAAAPISWALNNPSTYPTDSGLWAACKESLLVIENEFQIPARRQKKYKQKATFCEHEIQRLGNERRLYLRLGGYGMGPGWVWNRLESLVLTSDVLLPTEFPWIIGDLLTKASAVAAKMPKLETMEMWNAMAAFCVSFHYQGPQADDQPARITWGSWNHRIDDRVVRSWGAVRMLSISYNLRVYKSTQSLCFKPDREARFSMLIESSWGAAPDWGCGGAVFLSVL